MITTTSVLDRIRQHGSDAYPEEACGFLLGTVTDGGHNHVRALRRAPNRHDEKRTRRYQLTPEDYRAADAAARKEGMDIVGIYHSHPDHPARPSDTDLAEATFPGYTYVIVSIQDGQPANLTAWTLAPDRSAFRRDEIDLQTPSAA